MNDSMLRLTRISLLTLVMLGWADLKAWDFCQPNRDGVMLYYNRIYDGDACEVAYCKDAQYLGKYDTLWIPDIVIRPAESEYEGWEIDTVLAVVGIEANTFKNLSSPYVHIPETVSEIGDNAFQDSHLRTVSFGKEWCFRIGKCAFLGCKELDSVTIPSCVMEIGNSAFRACESLQHLVIEDNENFTELPAGCFRDCPVKNFTLPRFIKKIGDWCFNAADIKMNNGVEVIGSQALNGDLEEIELPETVKELGSGAFYTIPVGASASYATPKRLYINCKTPPYCRAINSLGPQYYDFAEKKYTWTIPQEYKLIVPMGTRDLYQTTWPWSRYDERCIIQRDISGIETVEVDEDAVEESIFSLDGKQIDFKQKGVNIVRRKDGTAKKVLVK